MRGVSSGDIALAYPLLASVAMTGSGATALTINRRLAARGGTIVPLIAETGGLNAMIVDSTALPEQVVDDVVASAFMSAGQRCSALRLLFLQEEIAGPMIEMIVGAMQELVIGDPGRWQTDVGPVISRTAVDELEAHLSRMKSEGHMDRRRLPGRVPWPWQLLRPPAHRTRAPGPIGERGIRGDLKKRIFTYAKGWR